MAFEKDQENIKFRAYHIHHSKNVQICDIL